MQRAKNSDRQLAKNVQENFSIAARCFMNLNVLSKPGSTWASQSLTEGGIKRLHGNSPRGSTPNSKKIKDIPQQVQEPREPKGRSRKSLFQLEADWTERENLEGAVANLMCLPVTTTKDETAPRLVVKVSGSFSR